MTGGLATAPELPAGAGDPSDGQAGDEGPPRRRGIVRASLITTGFNAAGSVLGLFRDLLLARFFGATGGTDAFLVAWTVPETAAPLLIEDAMSFLMVPAFSRALNDEEGTDEAGTDEAGTDDEETLRLLRSDRYPMFASDETTLRLPRFDLLSTRVMADEGAPDSAGTHAGTHADTGADAESVRSARARTRNVVGSTLPLMMIVLDVLMVVVAVGAPVVVHVLAPGLVDPALAVRCMRFTAVTVLTFGLAGYLCAALRSHHLFGAPAAIYLAYNIGILALMLTLHGQLGVESASIGVAVGGVLMVAIQVPDFLRTVGLPGRDVVRGSVLALGAVAPIAIYTLTRQAQVFIERYLGSGLAAGTISDLNYAQKVAQVPMSLSVMLTTVTFPSLARSMQAGEKEAVRLRLQRDLAVVSAIVLVSTAFLVVFSPQVIRLLFEHGQFSAADAAETTSIMRVYSLGLLGQALVGALCRPFYSRSRPTWYPAMAMAVGLLATGVLGVATVHLWKGDAIALANAVGITLTAVLLLFGLRRKVIAISPAALALSVARLTLAAVGAGAAGYFAVRPLHGLPVLLELAVGGIVVTVAFFIAAVAMGANELRRGYGT